MPRTAREGKVRAQSKRHRFTREECQRGYQAASRVINTIDSCLDTLINHTGS